MLERKQPDRLPMNSVKRFQQELVKHNQRLHELQQLKKETEEKKQHDELEYMTLNNYHKNLEGKFL